MRANLNVPTDADWNILDLKQNVETDFVLIYVDNTVANDIPDLGVKEIVFYVCD